MIAETHVKPKDSRLRVVVGGFLGLLPAGGITWDYIQYPLGFASLGHDVFYIEDTRLWPVYQDDSTESVSCAANVAHLSRVMKAFGLGDRWAYRDEVTARWFGLSEADTMEICRTADVFVNVSCATFLREEYRSIPIRILVDSDPMFTQIQLASQTSFTPGESGIRELVDGHSHHFTFGENIGAADCRIPHTGIDWRPTRQPVCLDQWCVTQIPSDGPGFTTVMNWIAGRPLEFDGETWGQKDVEFMRIFDVPNRVSVPLSVVVGQTTGVPFPSAAAESAGWNVMDPEETTGDWTRYRKFIERSAGEFSVAKESYVKARTGWFSCRSACYLASGRPVIAQDTAWTQHVPSGKGLIGFTNVDEAVDAIEQVAADPAGHGTAARRIAEESFDAKVVLGRLLSEVGAI